jgi:hypothetical protein
MARIRKVALLRLMVLVGFAVVLVAWGVRHAFVREPFQLSQVIICEDLDEKLQPLNPGSTFPYGSRQLCLTFNYQGAHEGDRLRIEWVHENRLIYQENVSLASGNGNKVFYLLKEDASPLPAGSNHVSIDLNGRQRAKVEFTIKPPGK